MEETGLTILRIPRTDSFSFTDPGWFIRPFELGRGGGKERPAPYRSSNINRTIPGLDDPTTFGKKPRTTDTSKEPKKPASTYPYVGYYRALNELALTHAGKGNRDCRLTGTRTQAMAGIRQDKDHLPAPQKGNLKRDRADPSWLFRQTPCRGLSI